MGNEKVIDVVLEDGTLDGVVRITNKTGNDVIILSAPRKSADDLLNIPESNNVGVYLLLSEKKVYVGQSTDLKTRIKNHLSNKDWWNQVVLLTTVGDRFNHSNIDYLESVLIEKAQANHALDSENKKSGNKYNIDRGEQIVLDNYLNDALFLLEFIGVNVFLENNAKRSTQRIQLVSQKVTQLVQRSYAIDFLKKKLDITKKPTYAKRSDKKDEYAIDCQESLVHEDWLIVLNDHINYEFTVIKIPANSITPEELTLFNRRKDDPKRLSLKIAGATLIENKSKFNFEKYVVEKIPYDI